MNPCEIPFEEFGRLRPFRFNLAASREDLSRRIAREAVDAIKAAGREGRRLLLILPVGPLDYRHWAELCNAEKVSCAPLVTLNMDEYLDDSGGYIPVSHPLSFRRFIQETFIDCLDGSLRPKPENVLFPDPKDPAKATRIVEDHGGADICFGGFGITGHLAFNDPPEPGEPVVDAEVRGSRTRCLTINRESATQMAMGGVNGNWSILPKRAISLGMYELLKSRKIHLTFMRSWHSGILRQALFGPVTGRVPGSFVQEHPNVEVTLTKLAAALPLVNVAQSSGEEVEAA